MGLLDRLEALEHKVDRIDTNVQSLIETRSFTRGVLWAVGVVATGVSTVVTIFIAWFRGH